MTTKKTTKKTAVKNDGMGAADSSLDMLMPEEDMHRKAQKMKEVFDEKWTTVEEAQEQRAKTIKELNDSISLRNHIYVLVNGPRSTLISRPEENLLRKFANQLDREVVVKSLEMVTVDIPKPAVKNTHKAMAKANVIKEEAKARPVGSFRRVTE